MRKPVKKRDLVSAWLEKADKDLWLAELAAIRAYDAAKAAKSKAVPFERAVKQIERSR